MSVSINNTIHQRGPFTRIEAAAAAGLSPGHILERTSAGALQKQSTSVGWTERIIAVEDALQGNTTATAYATGDMVQANIELGGNLVQAMLHAGTNYTTGMKLCCNGDGTLKQVTGSEKDDVAVVIDALDLSASGAVDTLTKVRIM